MEDRTGLSDLLTAGSRVFAGFSLDRVASTTSTQDVVRAAARSGAPAGYCCLAATQSAGRGRQGRAWETPPGTALLVSVLLRITHGNLGGVPIAAGIALRAGIAATSACEASLKWPNDIILHGRKLAGILCEVEAAAAGEGTAVALGMGVNLTVPSFPPGVNAISLHEVVAPPPPEALLTAVLTELGTRLAVLDAEGVPGLRAEWMEHNSTMGAAVTVTSCAGSLSGVADGIDDDGALILRGSSGAVRVLAGDVHVVAHDGGKDSQALSPRP